MKAIQATPESIVKILRNHEFVIPPYQRPYSWTDDQCVQLWDDLAYFVDNSESTDTYFLGSIVVYHPDENNRKLWEVIDGQQRLTTLLILIRALAEKASTHPILEKIIFKENPNSGNVVEGEPRLTSEVLLGDGRGEDLKKVLSGHWAGVSEKSPFLSNYNVLKERLDNWWRKKKTPEDREQFIRSLQDRVVLLPIECASQDDALTLFEIINNRGMPLTDVDIFKAKIFSAVSKKDRDEFLKRWQRLGSGEKSLGEKHIETFRIYMHISRAEKGISGGEIKIRHYMEQHHLRDSKMLSKNWRDIMGSLEACNFAGEFSTSDEAGAAAAEEKIYWYILQRSPNQYWQYPLYVFLNKYMTRNGDNFVLPADKHADYVALMRNTVRYFYLKAVVHRTSDSVKVATYNAYAAIAKEKDYVAEYYKSASGDVEPFFERLHNNDLGKCLQGLACLSASLNPKQNRRHCGDIFRGRHHLEHILPRKWNDYDKWTEESFKEAFGKIGNLMPLEYRVNIAASNEFFARKQQKYQASGMQDALDLSKKSPPTWYPEDIEQRQEEVVKRLKAFFTDPEFSGR